MRDENTVTLPKKISPKEYANLMNYEPLSGKELSKGKEKLKLYGSKEKIPWDKVYSEIKLGLPYEDIEAKYGVMRKIVLWAVQDGIEYEPTLAEMMDREVENRMIQKEVAQIDPVVVQTMQEAVNAYAPDVRREVVVFTSALVKKAIAGVNDEASTSNDTLNYAKAVQTAMDTIEVTQRHSAGVNINAAALQTPTGFEFVLDTPPDAIEAEIEEVVEKDTNA